MLSTLPTVRWRSPFLVPLYVLVAAFVVGVVVGPSGGSSGAAAPTPTPTPTPEAPGGFDWVPREGAVPGSSPPEGWYGLLEQRDCAGLREAVGDTDPLWNALAAVCAAALDGDSSQWDRAGAGRTASPSASDGESCLERAAAALLHAALRWHDAHPGDQPAVTFPRAGGGPTCLPEDDRTVSPGR